MARASCPQPSFCGTLLLTLILATTLSAQDSAAEDDIRGPKPLIEILEPEKFPVALWAAIAGGVLLLAVAWLLWKRHAGKLNEKSPQEIALASLTQLEGSPEAMPAEAFAYLAAKVVRHYIADRFGLAAPRRTTEEFLRDLAAENNSPLIAESDHLRDFLKSCDLAKFAGSQLDTARRGELLQAARGFITATAAPSTTQGVAP
ncbi:MAG: hypothetical protein WED15_05540 [Akkermansiaceae bacterium]